VWPTVIALAIVWIAIFLIIFRGRPVSGKVAVWTVLIPWVLLIIMAVRG
jgi:hypothetical protein